MITTGILKYAIEDVFRLTSFPQNMYIDRLTLSDDTYEFRLKKVLRSSGCLISMTGSSKMDKSA